MGVLIMDRRVDAAEAKESQSISASPQRSKDMGKSTEVGIKLSCKTGRS